MKKFIAALVALAVLATATVTPATAFDARDGALLFGGIVGGLVLGEALDRRAPPPPDFYSEDAPVRVCKIKRYQVWSDYYDDWVIKRKRVCYWYYSDGTYERIW